MNINVRTQLFSAIALGAVAWTMPAAAQDAAGAEADDNRIVVTARKREENLIEVPLAVTVATAEQLQRDQINNVTDLQRIAPALEVSQTSGGETNGGGRLRGLGTGVFNPSVASSVALVLDQVPVGNLNFPLLYDLAQVEVLRGPQGTLFGQGASAGVLNISSRRPEFDAVSVNASLDFADKGTVGSEVGELIANAGINLPLGETLALRVATQFKRETGLQRSVTTGENNQIDDLGIRARLRWEPSDSFSLMLSGEYGKETSDGQTFFAIAIAPNSTAGFVPPGPPPRPAPVPIGGVSTGAFLSTAAGGCAMPEITERAEWYCENAPSDLQLTMKAFSAVAEIELSDSLSFTSVSAYRQRTFDQYSRDFSRLTSGASARQENVQENADSLTQELRLTYVGDAVDLVGGLYYSDFRFEREPIGTAPFTFGSALLGSRVGFSVCPYSGLGFCPVAPNFTQEVTHNRVMAAFVDATFAVTDQLDIFGGLRLDDYSNTTTSTVFRAAGNTVTGPFDTTDSNISGRIGFSYMPNRDVNLFASYSRGYKTPAVGTTAAGTLFELAPETVDAFELGVKYGVGRMQLTGNLFYTMIDNFQSQRSEFAGTALVSVPFNVPNLTSKGVEFNAFGELLPGFNINAGYQFNILKYPAGTFGDDAVDTNGDRIFDANVVPGLPFTLGGTQFLNAPKHKFTLSGDYGFPVGDTMELFLNANVVWKSEVLLANRADPRYRYPGHALVNTGFGVRDQDGGWTASVFVRNLTKEREPMAYLASTFFGTADGGLRAWPVSGLTARVVGVRVGFEF